MKKTSYARIPREGKQQSSQVNLVHTDSAHTRAVYDTNRPGKEDRGTEERDRIYETGSHRPTGADRFTVLRFPCASTGSLLLSEISDKINIPGAGVVWLGGGGPMWPPTPERRSPPFLFSQGREPLSGM